MKNFIITTGAVILIVTIMSYQFQCNRLLREKQQLKYVADEAAATAALCFDEVSFGEGRLLFDRKRAMKKAEQIIAYNLQNSKLIWKISFEDQDVQRPSVTITIEKDRLKIMSKYDYLPY